MKARPFLIFIVLFIAPALDRPAYSGPAVTMITDNSYEDGYPQIKGDILVWQGYKNGNWEIFLFDISTEEIHGITANQYDDVSPQTDGNYLAWLGQDRPGGDVFLYEISTGKTSRITDSGSNINSPPRIADGRVVWVTQAVTDSVEPGEIMLYDIATRTTTQLTFNSQDDSGPRINNEAMVWVRTELDGDMVLHIYDLATGNSMEAPEDYVWQEDPQSDGALTVSTRYDGIDREIVVYNHALKTYEQITDNVFEDTYPRISGGSIAWVGGAGTTSEIFLNADVNPISLASSGSSSGLSGTTNTGGGGGGCFIAAAAQKTTQVGITYLLFPLLGLAVLLFIKKK